jgi:hypothetical protein
MIFCYNLYNMGYKLPILFPIVLPKIFTKSWSIGLRFIRLAPCCVISVCRFNCRTARRHPPSGADFMKPFRPEFTDMTLSGNFKVCNYDLEIPYNGITYVFCVPKSKLPNAKLSNDILPKFVKMIHCQKLTCRTYYVQNVEITNCQTLVLTIMYCPLLT